MSTLAHACVTAQLTVDLLATYKRINMIYYEKKKYNDGFDDKHGDYILNAGDVLVSRARSMKRSRVTMLIWRAGGSLCGRRETGQRIVRPSCWLRGNACAASAIARAVPDAQSRARRTSSSR